MKRKSFISIFLLCICSLCFILSGCDKTPAKYEISTLVNGAIFGTVNDIDGEYTEGTEVTIKANPYSNQEFYCWLHNGKVASLKAEYSFKVTAESAGTYIALFKCADLEYFCLESFVFKNEIPNYNGSTQQKLTEINLSFGYNQKDLYSVYSFTDESLLSTSEVSIPFETIYSNNNLPFAFDKTKDGGIYVKVTARYTTDSDGILVDYLSETFLKIDNKIPGTGDENKVDNIVNQKLNLTKNTRNKNDILETLTEETKTYIQNEISINFKNLSEFELTEQ